jgi:hypothetical protein
MTGLVVLAAVFVGYALVASRLARISVSAPMVFLIAGILVGPGAFDVLHVELRGEAEKILAELTLAILLFTDASTVSLRQVAQDSGCKALAQALRRGNDLHSPERWVWRTAFRIAAGELKRRRKEGGSLTDADYDVPRTDDSGRRRGGSPSGRASGPWTQVPTGTARK